MKKQSILSLVALVAILALTSCNKYEAKTTTLKTQEDSLNYALGLSNGNGIKQYYMQKDSSEKSIKAMMKALDKAYNDNSDKKSQAYQVGTQVGTAFKEQKARGFMGDSTMKFDEKLVKQGMVNSLNSFKEGMTPQQAQEYLQRTMMKIQMEKQKAMMQQAPQQAPQAAPQAAPEQAPQPAK